MKAKATNDPQQAARTARKDEEKEVKEDLPMQATQGEAKGSNVASPP